MNVQEMTDRELTRHLYEWLGKGGSYEETKEDALTNPAVIVEVIKKCGFIKVQQIDNEFCVHVYDNYAHSSVGSFERALVEATVEMIITESA